MQAKKRYFLLAVSALLLVTVCYVGIHSRSSYVSGDDGAQSASSHRRSFLESHAVAGLDRNDEDMHVSARQRRETRENFFQRKLCRMETCFDFSRCRKRFRVYVYPETDKISSKYAEILRTLKESPYYTSDPEEACVFVPSIDTLDRDKLSKEYVSGIQAKIHSLKYWDGGQNHLVFNLYSGTWPNYLENEFGFDTGRAMLALASTSESHYRPNFDISLPLMQKEHAHKGGEPGFLTSNNIPPVKQYTLVFKGKRYLTGIGSETRNSLYHIHNGEDIIMLTTCKHGKVWKENVDERCENDIAEYDKYDYKTLLHNSTFCLVPRGRRLGSYRFLEALQSACIPVLLSNGWVLPFSEVIDWNKAVIWGDERLLLQIPSIVRSTSNAEILALRQQSQFLWESYFSSLEKIVATTLEIIKDRIEHHLAHTGFFWNTHPGALLLKTEYSTDVTTYPFYWQAQALAPPTSFSVVVYATCYSKTVIASSPLYKLLQNVSKSTFVDRILILWNCDTPPPADVRWPVPTNVPISMKAVQSINSRFSPAEEFRTDAVLSLDEDALLTTDEVNFAFHVWMNFPERIVGYPARTHYWDETLNRWAYTSKWTNDYSMVLTGAAFYHRYYSYLYYNYLRQDAHSLVDRYQNCEDILMNYLVSHVTKLPPIKVTHRRQYKESAGVKYVDGDRVPSLWTSAEHFAQRTHCMAAFADYFGYMPLKRSSLRIDPTLFKDPVSKARKKYRQIEMV